jgi:hypothetical protein
MIRAGSIIGGPPTQAEATFNAFKSFLGRLPLRVFSIGKYAFQKNL